MSRPAYQGDDAEPNLVPYVLLPRVSEHHQYVKLCKSLIFMSCCTKLHRIWLSCCEYLLLAFVLLPNAHGQNDGKPTDKAAAAKPQASEQADSFGPKTQNVPPQIGQNSAGRGNPAEPFIGPGDELDVTVWGVPELAQHTRVSSSGEIYMPLIGYVQMAGFTTDEAQALIQKRLVDGDFLKSPHVTIYVKDYASAAISVAGEVNRPGVYSAVGPHRLLDIFQAAGGFSEKAGNLATISHRDRPNDVVNLTLSRDPTKMAGSNVELLPGDKVVVSRAGIVYVLGEVNKPGGFMMNDNGGTTVLRVIVAAGGPNQAASLGGTKMLRHTSNGLKEIPVPLKKILHAKLPDMPLQPEDILYVPNSSAKRIMNAGSLLTAIGSASIYRIPW
jgi:polysaccharide export outer membrane protein